MRLHTGELVVLALFSLTVGLAWWFLGQAASTLSLFAFGMGGGILLVAISLIVITTAVDERGMVPLLMVAAHTAFALIFGLGLSWLAIVAAISSFFLASIAVWRMRQGRNELLKFSFGHITGKGLTLWMWAVGVMVGMGLFLNIPTREGLVEVVPAKIVDFVFPVVARAVGSATGIDIDTTIDGLFSQLSRTNDLRALQDDRENLSRNVGLSVSGDMTVRELLSLVLARQFRIALSLFGNALAVGFIVIFIFIFQVLALPAQLILGVLNPVLLRIFRWAGLVNMREETLVHKMPQWT
ncbi:MAG: hypothetical protein A2806_03040 [Candidatus Terrybacteria bacterium RIFCSPHIGHO2_01_FULL_48_17]|uniref:Uncharacterized protein n=1 Tax=Candidatus Terrybacteria bacterium RIFCSPHIGHO2_01_FULL_48_17 TaxID=1802362 RepID=A0A1G2PJH2_9BACT|nr:MAG: hypothetical protein A2806_03040 [Candidatus Terrybacteria bacterium RIFCSPHIGHO2_01_FULL_48_17]OHA53052.1 MAG: hypothetical protein A3A30_02595 [Candidatus Terrybacteria bacterium RIFCSPLOWO2_01_FULL_48_14]